MVCSGRSMRSASSRTLRCVAIARRSSSSASVQGRCPSRPQFTRRITSSERSTRYLCWLRRNSENAMRTCSPACSIPPVSISHPVLLQEDIKEDHHQGGHEQDQDANTKGRLDIPDGLVAAEHPEHHHPPVESPLALLAHRHPASLHAMHASHQRRIMWCSGRFFHGLPQRAQGFTTV